MSDNGWAALMSEGFGLAVIRALGPDGRACKWVNLYSESSCLMESKSENGKKKPSTTPRAGIDELNFIGSRRRIA
eukprot:84254-Pyramimonas_sp.AAC.1